MALTITKVTNRQSIGNVVVEICDVQFDDSYPTGGEAVLASDFEMSAILVVLAAVRAAQTFEYVASTGKIIVYDADGAQVANAVDLSGTTTRVVVYGRA